MTSVSTENTTSNDEFGVHCAPAMSHEIRSAIAILILGTNSPNDPRVDQMIAYSHSAGYSLDHLWVAKPQNSTNSQHQSHSQILASILLIPMPGHSGMLFISPTPTRKQRTILEILIRSMIDHLASKPQSNINFYQSLLDPAQSQENTALRNTGFFPLASLAYMHKRTDYIDALPPIPFSDQNIQAHTYSDQTLPLFKQAILDSYQDTLDCPGLLGIRNIDDIIEGHKATGAFDPNMWHVFTQNDQPFAVMLISKLGKQQSAELVYFGIAKSHRRKGFSKPILSWGLHLAAYEAQRKLMLAVDQNNVPALKLYHSLGFVQTGVKNALIYTEKIDK
ncbi:GNAT family N-acetyltransferase [Planctomycetota bacterium]|nr:GNAT family N-acetyltransferase [Planctomycetota bacterium]